MKFLVLGCNGMAGHMVSLYLKEKGHDVLGVAREKSRLVESCICDVENQGALQQVVLSDNFDAVVNCIGILNQFAEQNKSRAVYLNSYLPHYLAAITKDRNTIVVHMSTDCVFSGRTGGYTEASFRDGESFYDRTKAIGELVDEKNLTLRNSIVGPDIKASGIGLLNWFMKQKGLVNGYTKAIWTGMTTLELAKVIEKMVLGKESGLYNMVPENSISKYELLKLFNQYLRKDKVDIKPSDGFCCDKSLQRTNFKFQRPVSSYKTMVIELRDWMLVHRKIYPHYDI